MSYHDDVGKFITKKLWDWKVPITADFITVLSLAFPLVAFFYFDTHILLAAFLISFSIKAIDRRTNCSHNARQSIR